MTAPAKPPPPLTFSHDALDLQPCESCRLPTVRRFKPMPGCWERQPRDTFRYVVACTSSCAEAVPGRRAER